MDLREAQKTRAQGAYHKPRSVDGRIQYCVPRERISGGVRFEELQHCVYLNALRRQQRPIYGKNVVDLVSIDAFKRPCRPRPRVPRKIMAWFENDSNFIRALTPTLDQRADSFKMKIDKVLLRDASSGYARSGTVHVGPQRRRVIRRGRL